MEDYTDAVTNRSNMCPFYDTRALSKFNRNVVHGTMAVADLDKPSKKNLLYSGIDQRHSTKRVTCPTCKRRMTGRPSWTHDGEFTGWFVPQHHRGLV